MKILDLAKLRVDNPHKMGEICEDREPNITEDCFFSEDGEVVGMYLKEVPETMRKIVAVANNEFNSKRVPKSNMNRGTEKQAKMKGQVWVEQLSTILGSVPAKTHMRRMSPNVSSCHSVKSAQIFVKAMLMLVGESERLIKDFMPEQYERQKKIIEDNTDERFRFGKLFTSSISNYNIAAPYHRDNSNLKGTVNVIISKRSRCTGGNLHVPEYDMVLDQNENSMIIYPAWRNMHGVTPLHPRGDFGYRNSFIFYPLRGLRA